MYRYLDHPSEEYIEVQASNPEEVFCEAARALFQLMTDISRVRSVTTFTVENEGETLEFLLVDWLNRLILLHEVESIFLSGFEVHLQKNEIWKLSAKVSGEPIGEHHEKRAHAKSVTFGQLEWRETESGHMVRFVVDI